MADFFERVKQGIDKGVTAISVKSKEVLESTRLKSQMATLREQRKAATEELGNIVYTMFVKAAFDEGRINTKCQALAGIEKQINELEEELRKIHLNAQEVLGIPTAAMSCSCGAEIYSGANFCRRCGRRLDRLLRNHSLKMEPDENPTESAASEAARCGSCGASLKPAAKFCRSCGSPKN